LSGFKIGIIGAGNVGSHLSRAFSAAGNKITVYTRRGATHLLEDVRGLVWTEHLSSFRRGYDFIIIAVNDASIGEVAAKIVPEEGIVVHTSGSTSIDVLSQNKLSHYGVMYPLQSFKTDIQLNYKEIPLFIEGGSDNDLKKIRILAESFSPIVIDMISEQRKRLHLAGVAVNNFTNHLYNLSEEYLSEHQISYKHLLPLIKETARRIEKNKPSEMQTGPAKRGDKHILEEHINMLEKKKEFKELYALISNSIGKRYKSS